MEYYERNKSMIGRKIADELLLVPIKQNVAEVNYIYTLNEIGAFIWELIDSKTSLDKIVSAITTEYKVSNEQAIADTKEFLEHLTQIGAINLVDNTGGED